jgi:hypothetical protein
MLRICGVLGCVRRNTFARGRDSARLCNFLTRGDLPAHEEWLIPAVVLQKMAMFSLFATSSRNPIFVRQLQHREDAPLVLRNPRISQSERLALLGSRDVVVRVYHDLHNHELSAVKAGEVIAHLSHGKSFLAAAETADENVRPLLHYYAVLAFARGFLLLSNSSLRETALAQSHGLSAVGWKDHLASGGDWLDARVRVEGGTFSQLAELTQSRNVLELFQHTSTYQRVNITGLSSYPSGFTFTVRDVLSRLPSVATLYEAIVDQPAANWYSDMMQYGDYWRLSVTANARGLPSEERLRELLSLDSAIKIESETVNFAVWGPTKQFQLSLPNEPVEKFEAALRHFATESASLYLVEPFPDGTRMSHLSLLFAVAYCLGMLVRYHPTYWSSVLGQSSGDRVLPLIHGASAAVTRFPNVALAML